MGPGCRVEPACTQQSEPFKVSYRSPNFRSADHEIAPNSIFFPAVGCRPRWSFGWPAVARAGKGPTCLVCFSALSAPHVRPRLCLLGRSYFPLPANRGNFEGRPPWLPVQRPSVPRLPLHLVRGRLGSVARADVLSLRADYVVVFAARDLGPRYRLPLGLSVCLRAETHFVELSAGRSRHKKQNVGL